MIKLYIRFFILLTFCAIASAKAQEPVSSNGKFAIINGLKIYYEESGHGTPLILTNPFTSTCSSLKPFVSEFSKYFRVIAVDIPGHGRSGAMDTANIYSFKKAAEYILGFIDSLKLDSVDIIGPSSPAAIALYIATERPSLVKNLVIIGAQAYFSPQTREVITSWGRGFEDSAWISALSRIHGKEKGTLLLKQMWNFRTSYGNPSFTPDILSTITARTLIIHGDNDDIIPVSQAFEMYKNINKSYLWVVANGGHLPYLKPVNQSDFLKRVIEFLNYDWDKK